MLEIWVQSLDWEDPLEKGKATYSTILAWRIPWTEEDGELTVHGVAKSPVLFTVVGGDLPHTWGAG